MAKLSDQSVHPRSSESPEDLKPDPQDLPRNSNRLRIVAVVTIVALVGLGIVLARATGGSDKSESGFQAVKFGVFRGGSPEEVDKFAKWSGHDVQYAMDYSTRTTWDEIAHPQYMLDIWKNTNYRMVYGTAMLPTGDKTATMAAGARGAYDQYFTSLANDLVAAGQGDAIIRLGWEFNVPESRWHPTSSDRFIRYWQHIVKAMRSAPGAENLQFDWNVSVGGPNFDPRLYYPGSDYVDYVGVDIYDISWAENSYPFPATCDATCKQHAREAAWNDKVNGRYGLSTWAGFARAVGRPMSLPEWGLWERPDGHGGGDNAYFVQQMTNFIADPQNKVAYQAYFEFDVGEGGRHELAGMPEAGAAYRKVAAQ